MKYIIVTLFVVQLFACSKSNEGDLGTNPIPDPPDNTPAHFIKQLIIIDSTKVSPNDTISKTSFRYDLSNRIRRIEKANYSASTGSYENWLTLIYTYNGVDTLVAKYQKIETGISRETHAYTYDNERRLVDDSYSRVNSNGGDSAFRTVLYDYSVHNEVQIRILSSYPGQNSIGPIRTIFQKDNRGNVLILGQDNPFFYYEYDNMENPFARMLPNNAPYVLAYDFFTANFENHIEQRNKFSKVYSNVYASFHGPLISSKLVKEFFYTYDANGLTATSRARSYPAEVSDNYKLIYKY